MLLFRSGKINALHVIKCFILLIPVFLAAWILNNNFLFTPSLSYTYHPGQPANVVGPVTTSAILRTADPALRWRFNVDTLPIRVIIPRLIKAVKIRIRLNPGTAKYVKFIASAKTGGDFTSIIASTALDQLDWNRVTDGQTTLWMRDRHFQGTTNFDNNSESAPLGSPIKQYKTVEDFRQNPPPSEDLAVAGFDPMSFIKIQNYKPNPGLLYIPHSFRGSHKFYVYAADETIRISFDKIDLNRKKGADTLSLSILRTDELASRRRTTLKSVTIFDDGVVGATGIPGRKQPVSIALPNATPGVYLVDIKTSEDVIFNNLTSAQTNLAFINRIFLADGPAYGDNTFVPSKVIMNGPTVTFITAHDSGLQDFVINKKKFRLNTVKNNLTVKNLPDTTTFDVAKGDISIINDGLITLAPAKIISRGATEVDLAGSPNFSNVDYVVAPYLPRVGGLINFEQTYPLSDLGLQGRQLLFSIESPGLVSGGMSLGLKDIRVTLIRGPFPWEKIRKKISSLLSSTP